MIKPLLVNTDKNLNYIIFTRLPTEITEKIAKILDKKDWKVTLRAPRNVETEGVYYVKNDSSLQFLGYSLSHIDALDLDFFNAVKEVKNDNKR